MGRIKRVRKIQKILKKTDARVSDNPKEQQKKDGVVYTEETPACLFFNANLNLGPPYHVLLDTNFINFTIQNKIDLFRGLVDCFLAKCVPTISDCVVGELEKMGHRYRMALRIAKDPRIKRLTCDHKGTYADDCIVQRVTQHRCYIVATNDKELKQRIRKIPGVPLVSIQNRQYKLERLPDVAL
ncbi:rRNA-processing protein FCF1 homolog [Dermatophagoides farinae]|uniref:rRNA-processing protein FCF1 homolog n=1 Tax=Dermatophagoides farinae TaxID=6954 RepID=UPI003F5F9235